jgi:hypothetical protein
MKIRWRVMRKRYHDGQVTTSVWYDHFAKEKDAQKEADQRNAMKVRTPKRPEQQANPQDIWNKADEYTIEPWEATV